MCIRDSAYGEAGEQPEVYSIYTGYLSDNIGYFENKVSLGKAGVYNGALGYVSDSRLGNQAIRPERRTEREHIVSNVWNILTIEDTFRETFREGTETRTGQRQLITEQFDMTSQGDTLINAEVIPIMRSRNITFDGKGFKPQSKLFAFFDNVNMTAYCVPKLIEISMISGVFQVGETVTGETFNIVGTDTAKIKFKVAVSNHKEGPFNAPTRVFAKNPYTTSTAITSLETYSGTPGIVQLAEGGVLIPETYSSTSVSYTHLRAHET